MNVKIIAIIIVIVAAISITQCGSQKEKSRFVESSTDDMTYHVDREEKFTRWLSRKEYQSRFKNKSAYYKKQKTYPAYIEMDTLGNRRVV